MCLEYLPNSKVRVHHVPGTVWLFPRSRNIELDTRHSFEDLRCDRCSYVPEVSRLKFEATMSRPLQIPKYLCDLCSDMELIRQVCTHLLRELFWNRPQHFQRVVWVESKNSFHQFDSSRRIVLQYLCWSFPPGPNRGSRLRSELDPQIDLSINPNIPLQQATIGGVGNV